MGGQKGQERENHLNPSPELQKFLHQHGQITVATTTEHKVRLAKTYFYQLGLTDEKISCQAAPDEPHDWHRPEEIAQEKVRQVSELTDSDGALVIGTDVVIALNGDVCPLGKLHGSEGDVKDILLESIGPTHLGIRVAEIRVGLAAFSHRLDQGMFARIFYPFIFEPLPEAQVQSYVSDHKENIPHRAGGVDFAQSLAHQLTTIHGIENASEDYPVVFNDFQQAAFGFPEKEITKLLFELSRRGGKNPWERIYIKR